jgi:hypothetical protein
MLKSNILYSTVIENDGRVGKQMTFLGSVLGILAAGIVGAILFLVVGYVIALFS